jgi:uncharacterized membrane protein
MDNMLSVSYGNLIGLIALVLTIVPIIIGMVIFFLRGNNRISESTQSIKTILDILGEFTTRAASLSKDIRNSDDKQRELWSQLRDEAKDMMTELKEQTADHATLKAKVEQALKELEAIRGSIK